MNVDLIELELQKLVYSNRRSMGGQHHNGPDLSVRVTHPDFGIDIVVEEFREREHNKELATLLAQVAVAYLLPYRS